MTVTDLNEPETLAGPALGVDVGSRRVGLAAADPTGTIASPLLTLDRNHPQFWNRLGESCSERGAAILVVGLPRQLDGDEGTAARAAREFAARAADRLGLPVVFWDERFSTVAAERSMVAAGTRRQRRRRSIDSVAAALMLQSWLDWRRRRAAT